MAARGVYIYLIIWGVVGLAWNVLSFSLWSVALWWSLYWPSIAGMAISAIWLIQGIVGTCTAHAGSSCLAWTSFVTFLVVTLAEIGMRGFTIVMLFTSYYAARIGTGWGDLVMIAVDLGVHGYLAYVLYCYASACSSGTHNEGAADVVVVNQVVVQQQMTSPVSFQVPVAQGTLAAQSDEGLYPKV